MSWMCLYGEVKTEREMLRDNLREAMPLNWIVVESSALNDHFHCTVCARAVPMAGKLT